MPDTKPTVTPEQLKIAADAVIEHLKDKTLAEFDAIVKEGGISYGVLNEGHPVGMAKRDIVRTLDFSITEVPGELHCSKAGLELAGRVKVRPPQYKLPTGVVINEINLNTVDNPSKFYRDESNRVGCRCGNSLGYGNGMGYDPFVGAITKKHLEVCTGDLGETLLKLDAWYKAGGLDEFLEDCDKQYKGPFFGVDRLESHYFIPHTPEVIYASMAKEHPELLKDHVNAPGDSLLVTTSEFAGETGSMVWVLMVRDQKLGFPILLTETELREVGRRAIICADELKAARKPVVKEYPKLPGITVTTYD